MSDPLGYNGYHALDATKPTQQLLHRVPDAKLRKRTMELNIRSFMRGSENVPPAKKTYVKEPKLPQKTHKLEGNQRGIKAQSTVISKPKRDRIQQFKPATSATNKSVIMSTPRDLVCLLRKHQHVFATIRNSLCHHQYPNGLTCPTNDGGKEGHKITPEPDDNFWLLNSVALLEIDMEQRLIDDTLRIIREALYFKGTGLTEGQHPETPPPFSTIGGFGGLTSGEVADPTSSRKRKGKQGIDDMEQDQDTDSEEEDRPHKLAKQGSSGNHRFACPYFKRSPEKYMNDRTCVGPGWLTVHRVKEHVYRRHKLPKFQCNRCRCKYPNLTKLVHHQRSSTPCVLRQNDEEEGINIEQETELRLRKRDVGKKTESDKWREMYKILFPDDGSRNMPSPYHEFTEVTGKDDMITILARYDEYLQRELPACVQHELERELVSELNITQEIVKDKLSEILKSLQRRSLKEFIRCEGLEDSVRSIMNQAKATSPEQPKSEPSHPVQQPCCGIEGFSLETTDTLGFDVWANEPNLFESMLSITDEPTSPLHVLENSSNARQTQRYNKVEKADQDPTEIFRQGFNDAYEHWVFEPSNFLTKENLGP